MKIMTIEVGEQFYLPGTDLHNVDAPEDVISLKYFAKAHYFTYDDCETDLSPRGLAQWGAERGIFASLEGASELLIVHIPDVGWYAFHR